MIDFRSDTVTKPTKSMREAMQLANVGDDVYGDDPTVNTLEKEAAEILGKEAALFVPSGTMGNQIAIMAHTSPGDEIILGAQSHIKNYEVGAASVLSGVGYHVVNDQNGVLSFDELKAGVRGENIHFPKTSLICSETAHSTGVVGALSTLQTIQKFAKAQHIHHHLDGARIFNAAIHLDTPVSEIAKTADSVMFCLSKGLCSPVGSMLVGRKEFINRARKYRKMLGGGMRQAGVLAACGLESLRVMRHRLNEDHQNADYLAAQLTAIDGLVVDMQKRDINMVYVKFPYDRDALTHYMKKHGIILGGYKGDYMRLMTHHDITRNDIDEFITKLRHFDAIK